MTRIFAHRAIINSNENTIEGIKVYSKYSINVELDIRKNTEIYLAHNKTNQGDLFEDACKIITNSEIQAALHIKELELIPDLEMMIKKYSLQKKSFLFMDNVDYETLRKNVSNEIRVATYVNKKMMVKSEILWCDESKEKWFEKNRILEMHKEGKKIIAMSPELLGSIDMNLIKTSWENLINIGFDAICTNFPMELKNWLSSKSD